MDEFMLAVRPQLEGAAIGSGLQQIPPDLIRIAPEKQRRRLRPAQQDARDLGA